MFFQVKKTKKYQLNASSCARASRNCLEATHFFTDLEKCLNFATDMVIFPKTETVSIPFKIRLCKHFRPQQCENLSPGNLLDRYLSIWSDEYLLG